MERTWPARLAGAGAALAFFLVLLALLTYRVEEMGWSALNPAGHEKAAEHPCTNMLGPVGMYFAGGLYYLLGAAAVYGALLALVPTVGRAFWPRKRRSGQWLALVVMLLSACAVLAVQPWLLVKWGEHMSLRTPGGFVGYLDGTCVFEALLGKYWALCVLLLVHAVALIYFARLTPQMIYSIGKDDVVAAWQRWRENRRLMREAKKAAACAWQQPNYGEPPCEDLTAAQQRELPLESTPAVSYVSHEPVTPQRPAYPAEQPRVPSPASRPIPAPAPVLEPHPDDDEDELSYTPPPRADEPRTATRRTGNNLLDLLPPAEDDFGHPRVRDTHRPTRKDKLVSYFDGVTVEEGEPTSRPAPRQAPLPPAPVPRKVPEPASMSAADDDDYPLPPYELLEYKPVSPSILEDSQAEMLETQAKIIDSLESFRINVEPRDITRGPSMTRYEFFVMRGQSVQAVSRHKQDIMAVTSKASVNILAPIPGKSTVGVELENSVKEPVYLRELLMSKEFHNPKLRIPVALGKNVYGTPVIGDLAAMPHVIVAGTTGSGKSVCINSMLLSMLYKFKPDELKMILVDPKQVEMMPYKKLPHLAVPVVTDPSRVIGALRWAVNEMERRYAFLRKTGVRNLADFNNRDLNAPLVQDDEEPEFAEEKVDMRSADAIVRDIEDSQGYDIPEEDDEQGQLDFEADTAIPDKLPYIVIVVDELADLMSQVKEELEAYISRLAAKARAAGIHLILATQSPRSQVITGIIKTNLPCRIALKVASGTDSRVILDAQGAENLMGRGDLLFLPPSGVMNMERAQGAFVSDEEIQHIVQHCASHAKQSFVQSVAAEMNSEGSSIPSGGGGSSSSGGGGGNSAEEELYTRCMNLVITERKASTSLLQRRFNIGYGKAASIMELLEERGVISPSTGSNRPREVLIEPRD